MSIKYRIITFFSITEKRVKARRKYRHAVSIAVAAVFFLAGCRVPETGQTADNAGRPQKYEKTDTAMGTVISAVVYPKDGLTKEEEELCGRLPEELTREVKRLDEEFLSKRLNSSEVYRVNENAKRGEESSLSAELETLLKRSAQVAEDSGGAFDYALGNLTALWRIDELTAASKQEQEACGAPDEGKIREALSKSGYEKVRTENGRVSFSDPVQLDFGAIGKGYALDCLKERLQKEMEAGSVSGAVAALGGSILVIGEKPDHSPWKVAISDPENPGQPIGILEISETCCISTSGDYERFFEAGGKRYHHILDRSSGYPAESDVRSVTIVSKDGFLSDALSTACFVLGKDRGMELAKKYGAEILTVNRNGEIAFSSGLSGIFRK